MILTSFTKTYSSISALIKYVFLMNYWMNVFVCFPGDVLIQISETQRKLTAEVEGLVSSKFKSFCLIGFRNRLNLYCVFAGLGPVPLVPCGGSAGHAQECETGWRIHWSESEPSIEMCVYIFELTCCGIVCVCVCRAVVECMNWRWGIRLQLWSDSWDGVHSETHW